MSEWVLIIWMFSSQGKAVATARFYRKQSCENALQKYLKTSENKWELINGGICVEDKK